MSETESGSAQGESVSEGSEGSQQQCPPQEAVQRLLDALVYAPLGLLLEANKTVPDLAARGRQHAKAARILGKMALEGIPRQDARDPMKPPPS